MSVKITVIVYILICLEVGLLLVVLPWTPYWNENLFLDFINSRLHAAWLSAALQSGYVRGAVTGLGALNIMAGLRDVFRFRDSVQALTAWESLPDSGSVAAAVSSVSSGASESGVTSSIDLSDHQPPRVPPQP
jgi:hypothetical protein